MKYDKIVIGVDQSYVNTGVSIIGDRHILKAGSIPLGMYQNKPEKRLRVKEYIYKAASKGLQMSSSVIVVVERIRAYKGSQLSLEYVASTGALIGTVCDACYELGVPVYSVDTRVWKAAVVGTSKPDARGCPTCVKPEKWPTLQYVMGECGIKKRDLLLPVSDRCKSYDVMHGGVKYRYNDDAADAVCIGLYGFEKRRNLKKEW